jgi:predicted DsbA family dithiol-disulfide isomerase
LWDHPEIDSRSFKALQAAKCAQMQGNNLFETFHMLLFEAFHREPKDTSSEAVLLDIARKAYLDVNRFKEDLRSDQSRKMVGLDHMEGEEKHHLFGVPTMIIDESRPFFLKLGKLPDSKEDLVTFFQELQAIITKRPYFLEIKRT